jgi:transposase
MNEGSPKDITKCKRFFLQPDDAKQRQYEALRAYFVDGKPSSQAAQDFGYTPGSFRVLCHGFRREPNPKFFVSGRRGPRSQPKKSAAREVVVELRKKNYSIYEISETLKEQGLILGATAVREVLKEEGFAALPRRLDEERPQRPRPTVEPIADVRSFSLAPRKFVTQCGGLFLFVPDMLRLGINQLAEAAGLPGSKMIPPGHALRTCLALKLWSIERKSHVMALTTDEGLGLFSGLNVTPKKSFLSEYSCRITHARNLKLLQSWQRQLTAEPLFSEASFNLDFHSAPYYGEHPLVENHFVSMRSRSQASVLVFLAQDADGRTFCYSNADIRKGEEADEILRFVSYWNKLRGKNPHQLVFDSRLTTYPNLATLDRMGISFITLRRRTEKMLKEIVLLPASAWRVIELDVPTRKYRTPRVYEKTVTVADRQFRQIYILDLGHEAPTILLTNQMHTTAATLVKRYAQRMLIENALSDAVRFFHIDALSSAVGLKVDFDMALMVIASTLYRLMGRRMRGYSDAQARQIFRDIINTPADIEISDKSVNVSFHRRAHLPIILASGLCDKPLSIPWYNGSVLRLTTKMS